MPVTRDMDNGVDRREARLSDELRCLCAGKGDPAIVPRIRLIGDVTDELLRLDDEAIASAKRIFFSM
ncbi:hypothetical protein D3C85_1738500 [compost metagenome]